MKPFSPPRRPLTSRPARIRRDIRPSLESMERRELLASNAFIKGLSYVDINSNQKFDGTDTPLQGSTITLLRKQVDNSYLQVGQLTTPATGTYAFVDANVAGGLIPGDYRVVEAPPIDYQTTSSRAFSQLNPATSVNANTIDVRVVDPSSVWAKYNGPGSNIFTNFTLTRNNVEQNTGGLTGNYKISLADSPADPVNNLSAPFLSFCTDVHATVRPGAIYQVIPRTTDSTPINDSGNGAKVAYLYDKFVAQYSSDPAVTIAPEVACAYQIAIWELIEDASPDLTQGNFKNVVPSSVNAASILALANSLLAEAQDKAGLAIFLDDSPANTVDPTRGFQSMIATSNLDFGHVFSEFNPPPGSLSGNVYCDDNNDGVFDTGEEGIPGVTITLTGINYRGVSVELTTTTDADGHYSFDTVAPGTYTITETQPAEHYDGKDSVGTLGGTLGNDIISNIVVEASDAGEDYNFGELCEDDFVGPGSTATIGFWNNKNGQAIIKSLNGSENCKSLSSYLATNYPNLFGAGGAIANLTGLTNKLVASTYQSVFAVSGQKLKAQIFAVALATYVTSTSLNTTTAGQALAFKYGFSLGGAGTGALFYNIGTSGAAFGVPDGTVLRVFDILKKANDSVSGGKLWGGNTNLMNLANVVFDGINTTGDI